MLPPLHTRDMINHLNAELREKRTRSQLRELAVQHGEQRCGRIARVLFRRFRPECREQCAGELSEPVTV